MKFVALLAGGAPFAGTARAVQGKKKILCVQKDNSHYPDSFDFQLNDFGPEAHKPERGHRRLVGSIGNLSKNVGCLPGPPPTSIVTPGPSSFIILGHRVTHSSSNWEVAVSSPQFSTSRATYVLLFNAQA